jgi:hypothetical protein
MKSLEQVSARLCEAIRRRTDACLLDRAGVSSGSDGEIENTIVTVILLLEVLGPTWGLEAFQLPVEMAGRRRRHNYESL